jgi:hypothetical protein
MSQLGEKVDVATAVLSVDAMTFDVTVTAVMVVVVEVTEVGLMITDVTCIVLTEVVVVVL